jgi:hypothetical protein
VRRSKFQYDIANFNTMLLKSIFEWRFVAERGAGHSRIRPQRAGDCSAEKSATQFVLDLAIDLLELGGEIPHQHFQTPFAGIDNAPQFGALGVRQVVVGESDPGLHDRATPRPRACMDGFDSSVWHALIPGRAASGETMPQAGSDSRRLGGVVNGWSAV